MSVLKLEYISSDYHSIYFIRGHIDIDKASDALKKEDDGYDEFSAPKHVYFRARPDNTGEHDCWYYEVEEAGQGAFPVTMMMRDW